MEKRNLIGWHILVVGFCLIKASESEHPGSSSSSPAISVGPGVERRYACWGGFGPPVVSAQCPRESSIQVVRAGLKVQQQARCVFRDGDCGCEYGESGCNMPDVSKLCNGRSACRLDVTEQYIDTTNCKGFSGYMFIDFKCIATPASLPSQDVNICGGVASSQKSGYIHSPNYPAHYPPNQRCHCSLSSPPFSAIVLSILDFHVDDYRCRHDVLQLQYAGHTSKLCGHSNGLTNHLNSDTNRVQLTFTTNARGAAEGFWIRYQAEPASQVSVECYSTERAVGSQEEQLPVPDVPVHFGIGDRRTSDLGLNHKKPELPSVQVDHREQSEDKANLVKNTAEGSPLWRDAAVLSGPSLPQVPLVPSAQQRPVLPQSKADPLSALGMNRPAHSLPKKSTFEVNLLKQSALSRENHGPTSKDGAKLHEISEDEEVLFGFKSSERNSEESVPYAGKDGQYSSENVADKANPEKKVTLEIIQKPAASKMEQFSKQGRKDDLPMIAQPQKGPVNLMVDDNWMKYEDMPQAHALVDNTLEDKPKHVDPHPQQQQYPSEKLRNIRRDRFGDIGKEYRKRRFDEDIRQVRARLERTLKRNRQDVMKAQVRSEDSEPQNKEKSSENDTTKPWWWNFAVTTPASVITEPPKPTTSQILKELKGKDNLIPEYYYYVDYKDSREKREKAVALDDDSYESDEVTTSEEQSPIAAPIAEDSYEAGQPFRSEGFGTRNSERLRGLTEAQRRKLRLIQAQMTIIRKQLAGAQAAKKLASEMEKDAKSSVDAVTSSLNSLGDLDPTLIPSIPTLKPVYPPIYENPMMPQATEPAPQYARPLNHGRYQVLFNGLQHTMSTETPAQHINPLGVPFGVPNQGMVPKMYPSYPGMNTQRPNAYHGGRFNNMESKFYPVGGYVVPTYSSDVAKPVLENSLSKRISELMQSNANPTVSADIPIVTTAFSDLTKAPSQNSTAPETNRDAGEDAKEVDSEESEEDTRLGRRKKIRISKKRKIVKATTPNEDSDEEDEGPNRYRFRTRFAKKGQNHNAEDEDYRYGRGPTRKPYARSDPTDKPNPWGSRQYPTRYQHPELKDDPIAKMRAIYNSANVRSPGRDTAKQHPMNRPSVQPESGGPPVRTVQLRPQTPSFTGHQMPPVMHPPFQKQNPAHVHPRAFHTTPSPVHAPLLPASDGNHKVNPVSDDTKNSPTGEAKKLEEEGTDLTVSIVAGGVVAVIILIIAVGLIIRHFMNKKAHQNAMRQRHKRECAMRRTIQQRHGPAPNKP